MTFFMARRRRIFYIISRVKLYFLMIFYHKLTQFCCSYVIFTHILDIYENLKKLFKKLPEKGIEIPPPYPEKYSCLLM